MTKLAPVRVLSLNDDYADVGDHVDVDDHDHVDVDDQAIVPKSLNRSNRAASFSAR